MSAGAKYLERRGWTVRSTKRQGCMKIVFWSHPYNGTQNQQQAVWTERMNDKLIKDGKMCGKCRHIPCVCKDSGSAVAS